MNGSLHVSDGPDRAEHAEHAKRQQQRRVVLVHLPFGFLRSYLGLGGLSLPGGLCFALLLDVGYLR